MPISTEERLREKGWSEDEIQRVANVMLQQAEKKERSLLFSESFKALVYWGGLIVAIAGNFFASAFLIPLLLILSKSFLYILISMLGLCFGFMFSILIRDIEKVDEKHHIIGGVFIPAIAAINVYVMVDLSNSFNTILKLRSGQIGQAFEVHNPVWISVAYVLSFVLPYLIYKLVDLSRKKHQKESGGQGQMPGNYGEGEVSGGYQQYPQQYPSQYPQQYPPQQFY